MQVRGQMLGGLFARSLEQAEQIGGAMALRSVA